MLENLVNNFINSAAFDQVAVYTQDFEQVFQSARPIKATVKPDSKVMEHPLESGASITDHRILLPIEIELSLTVFGSDAQDTYQEIRELYQNAELLIIQCKAGVFENQLIASMPHEEDVSFFDALTIGLKLKQVQFANTEITFAPRQAKQANTKDRGNQQTQPANAEQTQKSSSAAGAFSRANGWFQ